MHRQVRSSNASVMGHAACCDSRWIGGSYAERQKCKPCTQPPAMQSTTSNRLPAALQRDAGKRSPQHTTGCMKEIGKVVVPAHSIQRLSRKVNAMAGRAKPE